MRHGCGADASTESRNRQLLLAALDAFGFGRCAGALAQPPCAPPGRPPLHTRSPPRRRRHPLAPARAHAAAAHAGLQPPRHLARRRGGAPGSGGGGHGGAGGWVVPPHAGAAAGAGGEATGRRVLRSPQALPLRKPCGSLHGGAAPSPWLPSPSALPLRLPPAGLNPCTACFCLPPLQESARRRGAATVVALFCKGSKLDFQEHVPALITVGGRRIPGRVLHCRRGVALPSSTPLACPADDRPQHLHSLSLPSVPPLCRRWCRC